MAAVSATDYKTLFNNYWKLSFEEREADEMAALAVAYDRIMVLYEQVSHVILRDCVKSRQNRECAMAYVSPARSLIGTSSEESLSLRLSLVKTSAWRRSAHII